MTHKTLNIGINQFYQTLTSSETPQYLREGPWQPLANLLPAPGHFFGVKKTFPSWDKARKRDQRRQRKENRKFTPQSHGNRIGHSPEILRMVSGADQHERFPPILRKSMEQVKQWYRAAKKSLTALTWSELSRARMCSGQNGEREKTHQRLRQMRSELREAVTRVLIYLIAHMEICSQWVGHWHRKEGDFPKIESFGMDRIADDLNMSNQQLEKVFKLLRRLGYIKTFPQHEVYELDGFIHYHGKFAIIRIQETFFKDMGLTGVLEKAKIHARKKYKKEKEEIEGTRTAIIKNEVAEILSKMRLNTTPLRLNHIPNNETGPHGHDPPQPVSQPRPNNKPYMDLMRTFLRKEVGQ